VTGQLACAEFLVWSDFGAGAVCGGGAIVGVVMAEDIGSVDLSY